MSFKLEFWKISNHILTWVKKSNTLNILISIILNFIKNSWFHGSIPPVKNSKKWTACCKHIFPLDTPHPTQPLQTAINTATFSTFFEVHHIKKIFFETVYSYIKNWHFSAIYPKIVPIYRPYDGALENMTRETVHRQSFSEWFQFFIIKNLQRGLNAPPIFGWFEY